MLQRVTISGINLPRLYIAENAEDIRIAQMNGIPYVKWTQGQDALIKQLLRPTLERMFPHIRWNDVLGYRKPFTTEVIVYDNDETDVTDVSGRSNHDVSHLDDDGTLLETADIASNPRYFDGGISDDTPAMKLNIEDYVGDMSSYINLDVLQRLQLMPAFIGDILDCIKLNLGNGLRWREGYNKRLGIPIGNFNTSGQLPNLVILDVSGSIPRGISATMISLIDTLRTQLSADLIITALSSGFYPNGSALPSPQDIRDSFGYGNETCQFLNILAKHISGKRYGHVFSFGDNDAPMYEWLDADEFKGTSVEYVHHYHTTRPTKTGYAMWCHKLAKEPKVEYNTDWCKVIYK